MKIDLYHLYKHFEYSNFVYPIVLDVLKVWAESIGCEVRVKVCKEADVDFSTDARVVAISVYTQTAPAAYRLSRRLREMGKVVVLGGPHFRGRNCREAFAHCDVVVDSVCEAQWKALLSSIKKAKILPGRKQALYVEDARHRFRYPRNFYETFKSQKWYQIPSVPTSIGCPYGCEFCSAYLQGKYILRDIETVYNEIAHTRGNVLFISDATFGLNKRATVELMKAVAPLRKKILVETSMARLGDREILNAMALGGVKWISVGIETLSQRLEKHGASAVGEGLRGAIDNAHDLGMLVQGNFICGLDCDGPESFDNIRRYCGSSNLDLASIDILTPYPNTRQYERLRGEGRIIDTNWEHYDYRHVVFRPCRMTVNQLIDGFIGLYRDITKVGFIYGKARQICANQGITAHGTAMICYNLFQRFDAARKARALRRNQKQLAAEQSLEAAPCQIDLGPPRSASCAPAAIEESRAVDRKQTNSTLNLPAR